MGSECGCDINKCCHENKIFEKYLKYSPNEQTEDNLQMFPKDDRDGNIGPIIACAISFAIIATICLLIFAYQYAK